MSVATNEAHANCEMCAWDEQNAKRDAAIAAYADLTPEEFAALNPFDRLAARAKFDFITLTEDPGKNADQASWTLTHRAGTRATVQRLPYGYGVQCEGKESTELASRDDGRFYSIHGLLSSALRAAHNALRTP